MRGRLFTSCYPRLRSGAGRAPFPIFHIKRDTTRFTIDRQTGTDVVLTEQSGPGRMSRHCLPDTVDPRGPKGP